MYDIITIGGATKDIMFYSDEGKIFNTPKDLKHQRWLAFEISTKILLKNPFYSFGGGAANLAVGLARLGFKMGVIVRLGKDDWARDIIKNFKKHKVGIELIQKDSRDATGFSFIFTLPEAGREHIAFLQRGANNNLSIKKDWPKKAQTSWFAISSLSGSSWKNNLDAIFSCKKLAAISPKIFWNPGRTQIKAGLNVLKKYLKQTEILQVNHDEAIELLFSVNNLSNENANNVKYLLKKISEYGPRVVVITAGSRGAYVYSAGKFYYSKTTGSKPADTTGVGDAFGTGFLGGYIMFNGDILKALKAGVLNSGSTVTKAGAQNGQLIKKELLSHFS